MKLIGYWLRDLFDDRFIAPQELATPMQQDVRERVARYLQRGRFVVSYRGNSWCRYHCGIEFNGSAELGDGTWSWPEGLAHYVLAHATALPDEFVEHALGNAPLPETSLEDAGTTLDFWIEWCRAHRNPRFLCELEQLRSEAERMAAQDRRVEIAALEAKHGRSASKCMFATCAQPAMNGVVYCASHYIEDGGNSDWFRLRHSSPSPLLSRWTRDRMEGGS